MLEAAELYADVREFVPLEVVHREVWDMKMRTKGEDEEVERELYRMLVGSDTAGEYTGWT